MKKKMIVLAMILTLIAGNVMSVQAEEYIGSKEWRVNFDGNEMQSNFSSDELAEDMTNVQPGDSITFSIGLTNSFADETDWYMTNEVLQTLEESNESAEGGAYTYILMFVNGKGEETVLYSSETVGGENGSEEDEEGLHQATNSLEDYFYLGRFAKDENGAVLLYVEIEGESTGVDYQETLAKLQMNFAVEKVAAKEVFVPKTGDPAQLMLFSGLMLASGVLVLIFAVLTMKKRREEKGE